MPIGGVKEKVLAARRAGITTVILPKRNEKDMEDVPANVRQEIQFRFVETMDDVLDVALEPAAIPIDAKPSSFQRVSGIFVNDAGGTYCDGCLSWL